MDAAGNAAAAFTDQSVTNASGPTVVVSSSAGTDSTYAIGETISLTATFAESVTVTTWRARRWRGRASRSPWARATKHAVYASGSGTKALVFSYTVAEGDEDSDGIAVAADALELNGGTIDDSVLERGDAHPRGGGGEHGAHRRRGAPDVSSASVAATTLTLTFDEALGAAASLANASFTVKRTRAGTEQTVSLSGRRPSARHGDADAGPAVTATDSGVKVSYTVPATGTNKLVDAAGNAAAAFTDAAVTNASGPALTVVVSSTAGTDSTYAIGDTISLKATFSVAVTVTTATSGGAVTGPRIAFTVGTRDEARGVRLGQRARRRWCSSYTVAEGDADSDGIAVGADALALNGGAIDDASSNAAVLTHAAARRTVDHTVDGVRPTLESASVDGTTLTLTFDEALGAAASPDKSAFTVKKTPRGAPSRRSR